MKKGAKFFLVLSIIYFLGAVLSLVMQTPISFFGMVTLSTKQQFLLYLLGCGSAIFFALEANAAS